jgi:hypothetical protein
LGKQFIPKLPEKPDARPCRQTNAKGDPPWTGNISVEEATCANGSLLPSLHHFRHRAAYRLTVDRLLLPGGKNSKNNPAINIKSPYISIVR